MTRAVLVFDDGPGAGMGHRRRMSALATAMAMLGVRPELAPDGDGSVVADLVVVDSYRSRADDRDRFRAGVVVAVDDLCRDLACDVVVDPSPGATAEPHRSARRVLVGPDYALIDPELARLAPRPVADRVETALVASGASDPRQTGRTMAVALARLLPAAEVRLAVGPWTEGAHADGIVTVRTEASLGPALADADLVLTAAGVTLIEALALGRPTVTVVLADNQLQAARGVEQAGAALRAGVDEAPAVAAALASDAARRRSLSAAARATVDGQGAARVARAALERAA